MAARSLDAACNHCMRHVGALGRVLCREHRRGSEAHQFQMAPDLGAIIDTSVV